MAIEQDYQTDFRGIGSTVHMTGGSKQTELTSLIRRVHQDSDHDSMTYAEYVERGTGNGRRIVGAPINTGFPDYQVVQIGGFFLLPESEYSSGGNNPFCAEYIGAWVQDSAHKGADEYGAHVVRLLQ